MGDHRLRDHVRRRPAARRPNGRPARASPAVRRRSRPLHGQLAARRLRLVRSIADRLPRNPGARRRAAGPGGAVDPDHDVRRRQGAQHRARRLGRGLGQRGRRRRAARRPSDQLARLVLDLLHQRPRRPGRRRAHPVPPAREPGRARPSSFRRRRGGIHHRRADAARLRDDTSDRERLGHDRDDRAPDGLRGPDRGVHRDRAALEGAAPADADLPAADAHRRQRDRVPARHLRVLPVLPRDPLHAAGAALLGDRDRRRLPASDADDHRARERGPERGDARSASGASSLPGSRSPRSRSFCSRRFRQTATTSSTSSRPSC